MQDVVASCPVCRDEVKISRDFIGELYRCKNCGTSFRAQPQTEQAPDGSPTRSSDQLSASSENQTGQGSVIHFTCPRCQAKYVIPSNRAGDKFECQSCGQRVQVPQQPPPKTALGKLVTDPIKKTVLGSLSSEGVAGPDAEATRKKPRPKVEHSDEWIGNFLKGTDDPKRSTPRVEHSEGIGVGQRRGTRGGLFSVVQCSQCKKWVPFGAATCPSCGAPVSFIDYLASCFATIVLVGLTIAFVALTIWFVIWLLR